MKSTEVLNDTINYLHLTIHFLVALVAGVMKELNKVQSSKFSFRNMIANGAVSSFVGLMSFLVLTGLLDLNVYLSVSISGLTGWIGGSMMDYLGLMLKKVIGKKLGVDISTEEEKSHSELINK